MNKDRQSAFVPRDVEASSVYRQWIEGLKIMKDVTDPVTKTVYLNDLMELYDRAKALLSAEDLSGVSMQQMRIIANQPLHSHVLLAKAGNKTVI